MRSVGIGAGQVMGRDGWGRGSSALWWMRCCRETVNETRRQVFGGSRCHVASFLLAIALARLLILIHGMDTARRYSITPVDSRFRSFQAFAPPL